MQTFREACRNSYDIIETDVCITKDNKIIVHHDLDLQRTCGQSQPVSELLYKQLPTLLPIMQQHFLPGTMRTDCNKLPLLEQVLQAFPGASFNIEIKGARLEHVPLVGQVLKKYGMRERVVWGAVDKTVQREMVRLYPEFRVFAGTRDYLITQLAYLSGLLPLLPLSFQVYNIPLSTPFFLQHKEDQLKDQPLNLAKWRLALWVMKGLNAVSAPMIEHLKKRGVEVNYWVCNTQLQFERALGLGASGIMTDEPRRLQRWLQNYKNK